jgi:hypothetical protein
LSCGKPVAKALLARIIRASRGSNRARWGSGPDTGASRGVEAPAQAERDDREHRKTRQALNDGLEDCSPGPSFSSQSGSG